MKNATVYAKKIQDLWASLRKPSPAAAEADAATDPLTHLVMGILRMDATPQQAARGLAALHEEFVDYNEMRVAAEKDIVETLGRDVPRAREKADMIVAALGRATDRASMLNVETLSALGKRELKAFLREHLGLCSYAEAYLTLRLFGLHAIPVDQRLVERLRAEEQVHPEADVDDVRSLLERVVVAKEGAAAFEAFCQYAGGNSDARRAPAAGAAAPRARKAAARPRAATKEVKATRKRSTRK